MDSPLYRYVIANSTDFRLLEREYAGRTSFFGSEPPLSQAIGYLVVLGFGAAFSIFTTLIVHIEKIPTKKRINSEMFK
jgi:hypothetical protein